MDRGIWKKRTLLALSLLTSTFVFSNVLSVQKKLFNAGDSLAQMQEEKSILQLRNWNVEHHFCYYKKGSLTSNACFVDPLRNATMYTFPMRKYENPILSFEVNQVAQTKAANTALLNYTFSKAELDQLNTLNEWVLVLPRNAHRATFLGQNMSGEADYGKLNDVTFGLSYNQLSQPDGLNLIINYKTFQIFGPTNLPIALVKPEHVAKYTALQSNQASGAALSKQLLVGLPLVIGSIAAVLDHSPAMLMLSAFGALRAIHTYIGFVGESAPLSLMQNMINYSCLGASVVFLLMFLEKLMGSQMRSVRMWHRAVAVMLFASIFSAGHWIVPNYQVNSTLIADSLSALFGIALVVSTLLIRKFQKKKHSNSKETENQSQNLFSKTMAQVQVGLALATLAVHGSVNADELFNSFTGTVSLTDPLDWRHMMLMPALLTAGLLEVGSVAKRMQTFGQEMAHKALIEKELKVGHDVQARMLPEKKFKTSHWQWRATYHPAEALAGDWFDIREIEFAEGKKMLAVCLADVTGHGVGSSLSTSVICSHWSLWCQRLAAEPYPSDKKRREELLASAPFCIHKGLSALRKNENCTAMMALLDPDNNEVTITSAGHPGGLILNKKGLRYVTTAGERLGGELMGDPVWTCKTETIGPDDLLVIYSDGIVPVGVTILSWAGQLKKRILAGEHSFEMMLMKTLHHNKRAFMQDPSNEDDMTLLLLKRNSPETAA